MKKSFKQKVKDAISNGVLFEKIIILFFIKMGFSNDELFPVELRYKIYNKLKNKYSYLIAEDNYIISNNLKDKSNVLWFCWLQGIDNAPEIIKRCYESLLKYADDWNIKVINKENLFEYVTFPKYIMDKWEKGVITNTHMSDIIRMELLIQYGGLWVDSTVFFTDKIPSYVYENGFFTYHHSYRYDLAIVFESWFMYSLPQNPMLIATRKMLYKYWEKETKLKDYFLFHLFFTISTEKYPELWGEVPFYTDITPHNLYHEIFKLYSNKRYKQIKEQSSIHKLTYKFELPINYDNTYYDLIIKGEI